MRLSSGMMTMLAGMSDHPLKARADLALAKADLARSAKVTASEASEVLEAELTRALVRLSFERVHAKGLRKHEIISADYFAAVVTAQRKGDLCACALVRPLRPDYWAGKGLPVNTGYAPLASPSKAGNGYDTPDPRWIVGVRGLGQQAVVLERRGARRPSQRERLPHGLRPASV